MSIIGFVLLGIGMILAIVAPINKKRNMRCSVTTRGVLSEIYETDDSKGGVGHAYIYSYFVGGHEYKLNSTILNKQVSQIGDYCTIWYNPKNPKDAQPFHHESTTIYTILLIVGIVMIILGIGMILFGIAH